MKCKICDIENSVIFSAQVLNKYSINYYHCSGCGFLQTEDPFWLNESYLNSINKSDTGYLHRNIYFSKITTLVLALFFDRNGKYLDYAGGYGVYVRLMRDIGFDFYWSDKYTSNLFANSFEYQNGDKIEAITVFECFEHFKDPIDEIEYLLTLSRNIIFSTLLLPETMPKPTEWWYFGLDHGQHIGFYSKQTFKFIAKKYHLNYVNSGNFHLLTEKRISKVSLAFFNFFYLGLYYLIKMTMKSKTWPDNQKSSSISNIEPS